MAHDPQTKATLGRTRLIGQRCASEEVGAAVVATALAACTDAAPCRSAACPVCGLAFQQTAVALVEEFIRAPARAIRNRMTAPTIVPASALTVAPAVRQRLTSVGWARDGPEWSAKQLQRRS